VFETPRIVTAAQEIWHQTAGVWLDRQSDLRMQLRGNLGQGVGSGLWTQMIGNWSKRKVTQEFSLYNGNYSFDVGYQQQVYGFMSGIDFGREALFGPDDAWLAGVLGGYIGSRVDFSATDTAAKYQGGTTGVYVTYLNQAYFIDALIKADFLSVDYAAPSLQPFGSNADAQARSIGARIDSGFRVPFAATSFIEPLATVSYVSTDIGDMALGGANVVYGDNDSLRARLGLRTGSQMWRRPGFRAEASLTASVWQEFLAKNGVQIVSAGPDLITTDSFNKTFFEVSGAVDFIDLGGGFSGHVKGDFRFADGGQFWSGKVNSGVRYRW
jgi:outer membrane autotransporter protein